MAQLNSTASPAPLRIINNVISEAFLCPVSKGKTIEIAELAHNELTAGMEKFRGENWWTLIVTWEETI